jgi:hypothetical protein
MIKNFARLYFYFTYILPIDNAKKAGLIYARLRPQFSSARVPLPDFLGEPHSARLTTDGKSRLVDEDRLVRDTPELEGCVSGE